MSGEGGPREAILHGGLQPRQPPREAIEAGSLGLSRVGGRVGVGVRVSVRVRVRVRVRVTMPARTRRA